MTDAEYIFECANCSDHFRASSRNLIRQRVARHWNEDHDDLIRDMEIIDVEVIGGDYINTPEGKIKQVREREVCLTAFDILVGASAYGSDPCDSYAAPSDDSMVCDFCGVSMTPQSRVKYGKDCTGDGNGYACEDCFDRQELEHDHRISSEYETAEKLQRRARVAYRENEDIQDVCDELGIHRKRAREILGDAGVKWNPEPSEDDAKLTEFATDGGGERER